MLLQSRIPIESLAHPVAYNIHFGKGFLLTHWKNLLMRRSSRENLCKKRYCDVPKTNRFVLKILEKLNHFVLKVRTGGFADSRKAEDRVGIYFLYYDNKKSMVYY